jgi:hypothetical protein
MFAAGKGSPEGGRAPYIEASLAMGVTVTRPDHGRWSSFC